MPGLYCWGVAGMVFWMGAAPPNCCCHPLPSLCPWCPKSVQESPTLSSLPDLSKIVTPIAQLSKMKVSHEFRRRLEAKLLHHTEPVSTWRKKRRTSIIKYVCAESTHNRRPVHWSKADGPPQPNLVRVCLPRVFTVFTMLLLPHFVDLEYVTTQEQKNLGFCGSVDRVGEWYEQWALGVHATALPQELVFWPCHLAYYCIQSESAVSSLTFVAPSKDSTMKPVALLTVVSVTPAQVRRVPNLLI